MIRLQPEQGAELPTVWFAHDGLPEQRFRLWVPEGFYRARKTAPVVDWKATGQARCWYTAVWPGEDPFEVTTELVADHDEILISIAVKALPHENRSLDAWVYRGVTAGPCLALREAPRFHQGRGERTFVHLERGLTAVSDTRWLTYPGWDGWFRSVQVYVRRPYVELVDGVYRHRFEDRRIGRQEGGHPIGWGISPDLLEQAFICTAAGDGGWTVATGWRPGVSCSVNLNDSPHCIHAHPVADRIAVGETVTMRGKVYLAKATPEEMLGRFSADPI
jgi:hypothetical protein